MPPNDKPCKEAVDAAKAIYRGQVRRGSDEPAACIIQSAMEAREKRVGKDANQVVAAAVSLLFDIPQFCMQLPSQALFELSERHLRKSVLKLSESVDAWEIANAT